MSETIGDVSYVDPIGGDVRQVGQPAFQEKQIYDLDSTTIKFDGAPSRVKSYVAGLGRGGTLTYTDFTGATVNEPFMFLLRAPISDHPNQAQATCEYLGVLDDLPPPKVQDSLVSVNVSTSALITDITSPLYGDGTSRLAATLEYQEARTHYTWFATTEPDPNVPLYTAVTNISPPLDRPYKLKIVSSNQPDVNPATVRLADAIAVFNTLTAEEQHEGYTVDALIPGKLWSCSVSACYKILGE